MLIVKDMYDVIVQRVNRVPLGQRLARSAFWSLAGSVAGRLLSMPTSVVLARFMGPAHYGELAIIQSSADLFALFAGFGLSLTATKHVAQFRAKDPQRAGRILGLSTVTASVTGTIMAGLLIVTAPWLATNTLSAPHLTGLLRIGAGLLFFSSLSGAQCGALYGFEAFRTIARLQVIIAVANVPLMLGGYAIYGLKGILWGMVCGRFVEWVLRHFAVRTEARRAHIAIQYRDCSQELPVIWQFSLPALVSGALVVPVNWICSAILVNQPNGYAEMGIYNAANQWYNALLFLPATLGTGLLPLLSDRIGESAGTEASEVLRFMMRFNAAIMLPCVIGLSLASPYVMHIYGRAYSHGALTLVLVVLTAGVFSLLMPVTDVIVASGRMWLGCAMNAGWAMILIPSTVFLVHRGLGSSGLAAARLFAYIFHAMWTYAFAYNVLKATKARQGMNLQGAVAQGSL